MKTKTMMSVMIFLILVLVVETITLMTLKYTEVRCHVDFDKLDKKVAEGIPYISDAMTVGQAKLAYQQLRVMPVTKYYIEAQVSHVITCQRRMKIMGNEIETGIQGDTFDYGNISVLP